MHQLFDWIFLYFRLENDSSPTDSEEKIKVSSHCKGCGKDFSTYNIFIHITHDISCKSAYTNQEIDTFKKWAKERRNKNRREKYQDENSPFIALC